MHCFLGAKSQTQPHTAADEKITKSARRSETVECLSFKLQYNSLEWHIPSIDLSEVSSVRIPPSFPYPTHSIAVFGIIAIVGEHVPAMRRVRK